MAGKKSKKSKAAETSAAPKMVKVNGEEMPLEDSLDRAHFALEKAQRQMLSLHRSWRSQLQRIGIMVLFLVVKQSSLPTQDCRDEIQRWNEKVATDDSSLLIGNWEAGKRCVADSLMEIFSVLCCLSLIWLLYQPLQGDDFASLPFRLAVLLVPPIVASYYHKPTVGCLGDLTAGATEDIEDDGVGVGKPRTFPVVLILLMVCFGSLFMMQYQQTQQTENIQKVEKLKKDLLANSRKTK